MLSALSLGAPRIALPEYELNLDLAPEDRYTELVPHYNASVWKFYNQIQTNHPGVVKALNLLVELRGNEPDEMQREVNGLAAASKLPVKFVQGIQTLYEVQTLMVPIVNFSKVSQASLPVSNYTFTSPILEEFAALGDLPWRGPGCTGIVATNSADGTVTHARNQDFAPLDLFQPLVYTGVFTKGGKELFRSEMIAGYVSVLTGYRKGPDGFVIERNTRYTDHVGGNVEMFKNLVGGRQLNGWSLRKIMEEQTTYDGALAAARAAPFVSTEYLIMSGVKKGAILSRSPDEVAYTQTLGQPNFDEPEDYIIITNFDFFYHDVREWFDPTGGKIAHPRRIAAQKLLNASATLDPATLYSIINAEGVIADTIFQVVVNVEKDLWNASQPDISPSSRRGIAF
jgi:hypothetical protein